MIRQQGFVAMLDVLGFSDLVVRDSSVGGLDGYVETVLDHTKDVASLGVILFSDTVVLYTPDDTDGAFDTIALATAHLLYSLLLQDVPLRGSIAHGSVVQAQRQAAGAVIAGMPVIEAYRFETQQQWTGVMLAPSTLRRFPDIAQRTSLPERRAQPDAEAFAQVRRQVVVQPCHSIPVETRAGAALSQLDGYAVVPQSRTAQTVSDLHAGLDRFIKKLDRLKLLAPDPRSQMKYHHAAAWLTQVHEHWLRAL